MTNFITLQPSDREVTLDQLAITNLEAILQTRFKNLDKFFALRDWQQVFSSLITYHSEIAIVDGSFDNFGINEKPKEVFPVLSMSIKQRWINEDTYRYYVNFEENGKQYEEQYDMTYPEVTFISINEDLKSSMFIELDLRNSIRDGLGTMLVLVPKNLDLNELCTMTGFTVQDARD